MTPPYVKPIVVTSAPAYFDIRCMEPRCDGRHDLTGEVMQALRESQASFTGENDCHGTIGNVPCHRKIAYNGVATYSNRSR